MVTTADKIRPSLHLPILETFPVNCHTGQFWRYLIGAHGHINSNSEMIIEGLRRHILREVVLYNLWRNRTVWEAKHRRFIQLVYR